MNHTGFGETQTRSVASSAGYKFHSKTSSYEVNKVYSNDFGDHLTSIKVPPSSRNLNLSSVFSITIYPTKPI